MDLAVERATAGDRDAVLASLLLAFASDPPMRWMLRGNWPLNEALS